MKKSSLQLFFVYSLFLAGIVGLWQLAAPQARAYNKGFGFYEEVADFADGDSLQLKYDFDDNSTRDPLNYPNGGGLKLNEPSNIKTNVEYDPASGNYNIQQKMGSIDYRPPTYMDKEQYMDYQFRQSIKDYWKQRTHADAEDQRKPLIPKLRVGGETFDRIFGGNTVDIRPQGTAELIFALNTSRTQNPAIPVKQRKITTFDFDMRIQLNVIGKIGDKLKITTNYNTQATFDFENQMKLEYTGYEDEIIKKIEAGNVNLPLTGSLITGSQSLFGIKTQLQFGALTVTSVLSQQKGKKSEVKVKGGAQTTRFEVQGDNYEANRHYFLAHYFRDQYNQALSSFPAINSGVMITRVEVWVGKQATAGDARNIVAFADLGEDIAHVPYATPLGIADSLGTLPTNGANSLYYKLNTTFPAPRDFNKIVTTMPPEFQQVRDYEKFYNARKLAPTEFTFNPRLGFISLNAALNYDEVLAVSFQYTFDGKVYQVGEFSTDGVSGQEPLFVKMLKATSINSSFPMWDLMMKNIYSIGAYQVKPDEFMLDVIYANLATGTDLNFLPEGPLKGKPLLWVLKLDRLNGVGSPIATGDGRFDFVDGVTINANNGRVIFPVIEPFGQSLRDQFAGDPSADKYVFQELYDSIRVIAQQSPHKNRFKLKGSYQSASGSDISLGASNLPQGSVTVTAGSIKLQENVDYTVDYLAGRVKIINEGILNSGNEITVALESNALFSIQTRTLLGTHLDYRVNKDLNLGATILHLNERPLTQKVRIGDEPISNTVWGLDGNYKSDAPFLTRWVDKLPLLSTKEMSTITASGEFAQFIPGHPKAIGDEGNSYLDDFEGSQSNIDIKAQAAWQLASIPQNQPSLFPEASFNDTLPTGFNRAKLNWYTVDPMFYSKQSGLTPDYYGNTEFSNNFTRQVLETEIFPNKQNTSGQALPLPTLDLAYYPSQRGPYNFDVNPSTISYGINADGTLAVPQSRWAGIMRRIETNDFETSNVQFIQFWLMDPFNSDNPNPNNTGELYFNLGNVSEDVLKDDVKSFENGLPTTSGGTANYVVTNWGRVANIPTIVDAFDNNPDSRQYQDIGLDGLNNNDERDFFQQYLQNIANTYGTNSSAYINAYNDPSADNYEFYRSNNYDSKQARTIERYSQFNGLEGNSPTSDVTFQGSPTQATTLPNTEDLNRDLNMSVSEDYFQYSVKITPQDISPANIGSNYITDVVDGQGTLSDGKSINVKWYQFKIPIREYEAKFGSMQNFNSIRFIRMFMRGFDKPVILRFARLELVRGEWRKYPGVLREDGIYKPDDGDGVSFNISAVNIEENGNKSPVNYVLPPGIERQINAQSANLARLNEQSIAFRICNLEDGDARAAFRNMDLDVRQYKKLKFYTHAEAAPGQTLNNGDLRVFIRLGSDYTSNYYEYEVPLDVTPPGQYNGSDEDQRRAVWPTQNEIEIIFSDLQKAKKNRNQDIANGVPGVMMNGPSQPYYDSKNNKITVYGNPNLATIKTIVIGVRNPKANTATDSYDDGLAKCGEVWVNELRLTDFNEEGGWAATGRVTAKMADFATVSLAGTIMTPGYGSIEKKVNERLRETKMSYDVSANAMLGKFVPEKINMSIPMFVGYSEEISTPQFNPLDPDILMKDYRKEKLIPEDSLDGLNLVTQDRTIRKSINFTNVKKERGKGSTRKPAIYDVENFAATYAFNETYRHNSTIELSNQKQHRAGLTWSYNATPKNYKPFAKSKAFKSKHLTIIRDFNFYLFPQRYAFSTDVNRTYSELKNRQTINDYSISTIPQYNKTFTWMRMYDLKYELSKGLKLDFNASNDSRILEPDGRVDNDSVRQIIKEKFLDGGKTMNYKHTINANYTVPINKLPYLDFITANVKYGATYGWTSSPIGLDKWGNVIQNTNTKQLNGQLNMVTLYNKVPYLKKINNPPPKQSKDKKTLGSAVKTPKNLNDTTSKAKPTAKDTTKNEDQYEFFKHVARFLMSVKTVSFTYSENAGTLLPGYKPRTQYFGMGPDFNGPTPGFILGSQEDIRTTAEKNDWLWKTYELNTPYTTTRTQTLNLRSNVEPIKDFKIELTANRNFTRNETEIYRWGANANGIDSSFQHYNPQVNGTFSMSFLSIKTAFKKDNKEHVSETFEDFRNTRLVIAQRRAQQRENATGYQAAVNGYPEGYNSTSQDVLIPAFMAAYGKIDPNKVSLKDFPEIPIPNWSVRYDGLSKIEALKKIFKTVTLSHAYRSSYSVANYTTNLNFSPLKDAPDYTNVKDNADNWQSKNIISAVSISEQFSPLLRLETTLQNSITTNVEYKKDRNLSLATSNNQLTELAGREIVVGAGYRFKDLTFNKIKIKGKPIKSDLNLKADFSVKRNETVIRKIVENVNQATSGSTVIKISFAADYMITEKVNVRAFYDRIINKPVVSSSFPTSNTNSGLSIRLTLQ